MIDSASDSRSSANPAVQPAASVLGHGGRVLPDVIGKAVERAKASWHS